MAEENENQEQQEQTQEDQGGLPKIDPRDEEIKSLKLSHHQLNTRIETLTNMFSGFMQGQQQTPKEPQGPALPSDEELDQAIATGQGAVPKIKALLAAQEERIRKQYIDPLRDEGLSAIAGINQEMARAKMPHYEKYKSEIDAMLQALPVNVRLNPQVYEMCYKTVVGGHLDDIVTERLQQEARKATQPVEVPGGRGRRPAQDEIPDAADLSPGAADALAMIGRDQDDFARRLGYKDWKDHIQKTQGH